MIVTSSRIREEGFTLIELMIVVGIVGILASLAVPNYLTLQCKSKQSEAKANLGGIFVAEESYRAEYGTYALNMASLGWTPAGNTRYTYSIVNADTSSFRARAVAGNLDNDPTTDIWEIDRTKNLTMATNDCGQ